MAQYVPSNWRPIYNIYRYTVDSKTTSMWFDPSSLLVAEKKTPDGVPEKSVSKTWTEYNTYGSSNLFFAVE